MLKEGSMVKLGYLLLFTLLLGVSSFGQQWEWARKTQFTTGAQTSKDICTDKFGNVFIAGINHSQAQFDKNTVLEAGSFIAKYDNSGNFIWARGMGGEINDIEADHHGNLYLVGHFTGTITTGFSNLISNGLSDIFLVKFNGNGLQQWARSYGGPSVDEVNSVAIDKMNDVYITGYFHDSINFDGHKLKKNFYSQHFYVTKLSSSGTIQWANKGTGIDASGVLIRPDKFNNMVIISRFVDTCYYCTGRSILKLDSQGSIIFYKKQWGYTTTCYGLSIDKNDHVYVVYGEGQGVSSRKLAKFDSNMNVMWSQYVGSSLYNQPEIRWGLSTDSIGNVYTCGYFGWYPLLNPGDSTKVGDTWVYSKGKMDILVVKIDGMSGKYLSVKTAGGNEEEAGSNMTVDKSGNCYLTGYYNHQDGTNIPNDTCAFDNDALTNDGPWAQIFVAKLKNSPNITTAIPTFVQSQNSKIEIYPNPSSGKFSFALETNFKDGKVCVYDITGRCVYTKVLSSNESELDLSEKEKGVYFVELVADQRSYRKKFIVE